MSLWSDLKALNQEQFLAELDAIQPPRVPTRRRPATPVPKDNRPVTRIAFVLQTTYKLSKKDAQLRLSQVLIERGYPIADIPRAGRDSLEQWLDKLLRNVPSADVMDAAQSL